MKKIILLDMDGVIADFHGAVCDLFGCTMTDVSGLPEPLPHEYAVEKYISKVIGRTVTTDEMWDVIDCSGQFWLNIEPYPWVEELWDVLKSTGCDIIVSTNPDVAPWNAANKITWLRRNLPRLKETDWMIGRHKYLMAKPGHILIDDCEGNIKSFNQHGGQGVLFPQLWNSKYDCIGNRVGHIRSIIENV